MSDFTAWSAETLFFVLNGEPILNTLWILVWILVGTVAMLIPFYLSLSAGRGKISPLPALVFVVTFFPILMLMMGPPLWQTSLLEECEPVAVTISTDRVADHSIDLRQCRIKTNFYGEWSEWQLVQQQG